MPIYIERQGCLYVRMPRALTSIVIDPGIHFGSPCLKGTRITVEGLAWRLLGGESAEAIARDHGITVAAVKAAWDYVVLEERPQTDKKKRVVKEGRVVKRERAQFKAAPPYEVLIDLAPGNEEEKP